MGTPRPGLRRENSGGSTATAAGTRGGAMGLVRSLTGMSRGSGKSYSAGYKGVLVPGFTGGPSRGTRARRNEGMVDTIDVGDVSGMPALVPTSSGAGVDVAGTSPARPGLARNVSFSPSEATVLSVGDRDGHQELAVGPSGYVAKDASGYGVARTPQAEYRDPFADGDQDGTLRTPQVHMMDTLHDREAANSVPPLLPVPIRGPRRYESVKRLSTVESGDEGTLQWPSSRNSDETIDGAFLDRQQPHEL
ncbi:hypothetical protein HK097_006757, partial [Rhizophlyctis rosea]